MPICKNPSQSPSSVGGGGSNEINDHASEAAKVKRVKDQAYFNSYNFDAIEEMPHDDDDDDGDDDDDDDDDNSNNHRSQHNNRHKNQQSQQQQQQLRKNKLHSHQQTFNGESSSLSSSASSASFASFSSPHDGSNISNINVKSRSHYTQYNHIRLPLVANSYNSSNILSSTSSRNIVDDKKHKHFHQRVERFHASNANCNEIDCTSKFESSFNKDILTNSENQDNNNRCGNSNQAIIENYTIRPSAGVNIQRELVIGVSENGVGAGAYSADSGNGSNINCVLSSVANDNGNFLLPRAMLKYQSVGGTTLMPLAIYSKSNNGSTKCLHNFIANKLFKSQQQQQQQQQQRQCSDSRCCSNVHSRNGSVPNIPNTNTATITNAIHNTHNNNNNNNTLLAKGKISNKIANNDSSFNAKSATPLLTSQTTRTETLAVNAVAAAASAATQKTDIIANAALPLRYKKKSASSSSSLVSASSSAGDAAGGGVMVKCSNTSGSGGSGGTPAAAGGTGTASSTATTTTTRDRASSHSHYSTDKSGSSGYYSSNVCSTYSIEDHIYCEPVIDILDLNCANSKSIVMPSITSSSQTKSSKVLQHNLGQSEIVHRCTTTKRNMIITNNNGHEEDDEDAEDEDDEEYHAHQTQPYHRQYQQHQRIAKNLQVLETSIENLDRHLKSYPRIGMNDRIASYVQGNVSVTNSFPTDYFIPGHRDNSGLLMEKSLYNHLPTIMESQDSGGSAGINNHQIPWKHDIIDDSLLDIDLDSFLLKNNSKKDADGKLTIDSQSPATISDGIDNGSFDKKKILQDEAMENNYKCAKYINSCPEDAYHVESDIDGRDSHKLTPANNFFKNCEDQLHFQNTRELLEDVREKIRLLSQENVINSEETCNKSKLPKELEYMIETLRSELESYLERLNQNSEMQIRQLCTGLVKNHNIIRIKKAFERRKSISSCNSECDLTYEAVRDGGMCLSAATDAGLQNVKNNCQHHNNNIIASIRCISDPNFKMKRKSINEVFPLPDCYIESVDKPSNTGGGLTVTTPTISTQLQKNLSFHKPILSKLDATTGNGDAAENREKNAPIDWHRKRPSIWQMYYGTNRLNQSLLGKRTLIESNNQATMSYPSSRPESDFTLDLPRAEQLRIKMEREKKFRQRCRYITSFLSLIFFLLTVMVVSLVLTRGKRMFGSML